MKRFERFLVVPVLAAIAALVPAARAQTVNFIGSGSSEMYQAVAVGTYLDLAGTGAHHYTIKGTCAGANCAQIKDQRSSTIPLAGGNLWVIWNSAATEVWAYVSTDSTSGVAAFLATPSALMQISSSVLTTAGQNLISTSLWGADATSLPSNIYAAINGHVVTAALTIIRPEDAKFAFTRAVTPLNTINYSGLGYGTSPTQLVGTAIKSALSTASSTPVNFSLSGTDPFTHETVPAHTTIDIGATPLMVIVNRTSSTGLGYESGGKHVFTNLALPNIQEIFNGTECDGNAFGATGAPADFPVTAFLREPLSGVMNLAEFSDFRIYNGGTVAPTNSQEKGVNPAISTNNPLNLACTSGGGKRERGVSTSEIVSSGVKVTPNSIGYCTWSFGNLSAIAGSTNYGYLTLVGIDPILEAYTTGTIPVCTAPCPSTPGDSFPNLRNGTYRSWTIDLAVTSASGINLTNVQAMITAAQNHVNQTVPDFVPFKAADGDPGLTKYRSHYLQSGVSPNNGLSGETEAGGDIGGCIEPVGPAPGILSCHQ